MTGDDKRTLTDVAAYLDELRGHLEQAQSVAATAVVTVRLAIARDNEEGGE